MPEAAKTSGEAGAKAFVRHFYAVISYAINTGDADAVLDLSSGACRSCRAIARNIMRVYGQGGRATTEGWEATRVEFVGIAPSGETVLTVGVYQHPEQIIDESGRKTTKGTREKMEVRLVRRSSEWVTAELTVIP